MRDGLGPLSAALRIAAVIPARDEAGTIAGVVADLRAAVPGIAVIVADNGSVDGTASAAMAAGATVVYAPVPGYGHACNAGLAAVPCGTDVVVFLDGDGSDCPEDAPRLIAAVVSGADVALGWRHGPGIEPGSIAPAARFGNWLCGWLMWLGWGRRLHDLSPLKAVSHDALERLDHREETYGWTIELLASALQAGLTVAEIETGYRRRKGGRSKVSGDLRASCRAGIRILATVARVRLRTLDRSGVRRLLAFAVAAVVGPLMLCAIALRCRGQ